MAASKSILRLRAAAAVGGRRHFSSSSPCLMLPSNKMYCLRDKKVVNINKNVEKELESDSVVGSSHGWVGLMKDRGSLSVWNPMSGSRMKLPPVPDIWKLVVDGEECSRAMVMPAPSSKRLGVYCPDECSEWTMFGSIRDCYADVVACSQRNMNRAYSLTSYSRELVRWNISDPRRPRMEWKERLHQLGYNHDDIVEMENNKFMFPPVYPSAFFEAENKAYPHLVYAHHSDQLFVVRRHYLEHMYPRDYRMCWSWEDDRMQSKQTVAFDVHLLVENENENSRKLRHMKHSLNGLVMFVSLYSSFAVAAADYPHLKPDSIYFTDHVHWRDGFNEDFDAGTYNDDPHLKPDSFYFTDHHHADWSLRDGVFEGFDVGIYDYKNGTISSCYYTNYHQLLNKARRYPYWFTPTSTVLG